MKEVTETTWLRITRYGRPKNRRTDTFAVTSKDGFDLGLIQWHPPWRSYAFFVNPLTVYEWTCLREIANFCEAATREHGAALRRLKERG